MTLLQKFYDTKKAYYDMIRSSHEEIITELLTELKGKYPGLNAVTITAYTPGWNDGEPCEHTVDIEILNFDEGVLECTVSEYLEDEITNDVTRDEEKQIKNHLMNVVSILDVLYGTNYQFGALYYSENQEFVIGSDDEYDCGY